MQLAPTATTDLVALGDKPTTALTEQQKARAAADRFEQIFVQQMVQAMRDTASGLGGEGMFGSGPGAGTYEDWFDSNLASHMMKNDGIGLADALMRRWQRNGWVAEDEAPKGGVDATA